jgi:drug/metabolite transporter (DMT)-like permease
MILAMVFSASVGITQKIHQASEYRNELYGLLFTAFAFGAVCSFLIYFCSRYVQKKKIVKVENKPDGNVANKKAVLLLLISVVIISGVSAAANNVINLYLSGKVQSAIFFPIVNGVPLVMYVITSFVLFKEKLSKKQWMGVLLGLAAVLCLCLS